MAIQRRSGSNVVFRVVVPVKIWRAIWNSIFEFSSKYEATQLSGCSYELANMKSDRQSGGIEILRIVSVADDDD